MSLRKGRLLKANKLERFSYVAQAQYQLNSDT